MQDIVSRNFTIERILNVLITKITTKRLLNVSSRHSDAFLYILKGSCTYTFLDGGYSLTVYEGDIFYLAKGAKYDMQIQSPLYSCLYCDFVFGEDLNRKSDAFSPKSSSDVQNMFIRLKNHYGSGAKNATQKSLADLYDIYAEFVSSAFQGYVAPCTSEKIKEIKSFIDSNFSNRELCLETLSKRAQISQVYFRKLFKTLYGYSPIQYIKSLRLEKAKEFLAYPFLTIEECALQSGFLSEQYFYREFKKATGMTPLKYRKSIVDIK